MQASSEKYWTWDRIFIRCFLIAVLVKLAVVFIFITLPRL